MPVARINRTLRFKSGTFPGSCTQGKREMKINFRIFVANTIIFFGNIMLIVGRIFLGIAIAFGISANEFFRVAEQVFSEKENVN
jgi:hypothetical protein